MPVRCFARSWTLGLSALLVLAGTMTQATAGPQASVDRMQMYRTPARMIPYNKYVANTTNASRADASLSVSIVGKINLTGDPLLNNYGNVLPIDAFGDGKYELLHYNGYRFVQLFDQSGKLLWRVDASGNRSQSMTSATHRDSWAILDVDGDGEQDIVQCWAEGSVKYLETRRGSDGKVIKKVALPGQKTSGECHINAYWMDGMSSPLILVAHTTDGGSSACGGHNYVDYWSRTVAFDKSLNQLWSRETCNAGHATRPLDLDGDGYADQIFVGKYLLDRYGKIKCTLAGWNSKDHVDSLQVWNVDYARTGTEVIAVGETDAASFDAATCKRLWTIPKSTISNVQDVNIARLGANDAPTIFMTQRNRVKTIKVAGNGKVLQTWSSAFYLMQNGNVDGARISDDIVGMWGEVRSPTGASRLTKSWYWNLVGTKTKTSSKGPYPNDYDRWAAYPLVFDLDHDGKDEIVTWGQTLIVIGKVK